MFTSYPGFIAVHLGIGKTEWSKDSNDLIEKAIQEAAVELIKTDCPKKAVVRAITILENSSLTNAGFGSNLNQDGYVECDASIMDGESGLYGCVGALQEVGNPIAVAFDLLEQQKIPRPLGLLPPDFLTGEGARKFALTNGHLMRNLTSSKSIKRYKKYLKLLKETETSSRKNEDTEECFRNDKNGNSQVPESEIEVSIISENENLNKRPRLDTVGAIAINSKGYVSVGSSSGGISLKHPGRVGSAARIGAGCWADQHVGVTATGNGEYISKIFLSKEITKVLSHGSIESNIEKIFVNNRLMSTIQRDDLIAGYIGARFHPEEARVDFFCDIYGGNIFVGFRCLDTALETKFLTSSNKGVCYHINL